MPPEAASGHLERACAGIRQALAGWNAADLDRVESSRALLAAAIGEMRLFESAALAGQITPTPEICAAILAAKQEIVRATRVVDACVAFYRGLAARTGEAPPVYDSEGRLTGESGNLEPEMHA